MFRFDSPPSLRLSRGELINWRQTRSVRLQVVSGLLWVTRENDFDDHFLRPGDSLLLPRRVPALIGAQVETSLRFEQVETRSRAVLNRLSMWLSRARRALPIFGRPTHRQAAATVPG